jgi:hypothetical protein
LKRTELRARGRAATLTDGGFGAAQAGSGASVVWAMDREIRADARPPSAASRNATWRSESSGSEATQLAQTEQLSAACAQQYLRPTPL